MTQETRRSILSAATGLLSMWCVSGAANAAAHCSVATENEANRVFDEFQAAYEARDAGRILSMIDDDFYFEDPTAHLIAKSREEMRPIIEPAANLYRELRVRPFNRIYASPWIISQQRISGTLTMADGSTRKIDVQGLTMLQIRDTKIARWYDYYDVLTFKNQSK